MKISILHASSLGLLLCAFVGVGSASSHGTSVGSGSGGGLGTGPSPKGCPHTGTEWEEPKVSSAGATTCSGTTFEIFIGIDGVGGSIVIKSKGCPAFLIIQPGHDKKINKLYFRAVNPQQVPWQKQTYKCRKTFFGAYCEAAGDPKPTSQTVTDWEEEACDLQTGPAKK